MLPKGNVSKHHARLLFRDGRFIVTDLKSTNGTYVNGRKIAQATIVREGDKIYIGDFVLRLEGSGAVGALPDVSQVDEESIRTLARENAGPPPARPAPNAPVVTLKAPTHPPAAALPRPQGSNVSSAPPVARPSEAGGGTFAAPDQDPDDSAPLHNKPRIQPVAPPPAVPQGASSIAGGPPRPMTMPLNQMSPPMIGNRVPTAPPGGLLAQPPTAQPGSVAPPPVVAPPAPLPQPPPAVAPPPLAAPPPPLAAPPPPLAAPPPAPAPVLVPSVAPVPAAYVPSGASSTSIPPAPQRPTSPPGRVPPKESPAQAGRRLALTMLVGRIADAIDLSPLRESPVVPDGLAQQIERAARDQAKAMHDEGEAPQDIDLDAVLRDAHRELVGLGALGPLLDDEEVAEIHCVRYDQLLTVRTGSDGPTSEATSFSSEEALHRVIARLAHQSGATFRAGDSLVAGTLARGAFQAVLPPAAATYVLSIRKRRRVEATLEDLVRSAALSRPMAQFLEASVAAGANILVSGSHTGGVLSALAGSGAQGPRVCVVQDAEEIAVGSAHLVSVSVGDARQASEDAVRAAARLHPNRLVVARLAGAVAVATLDAVVEGREGVLAAIAAPSLRQGLARLVAQLVLHRPGLGLESARDVVGEAFDLAVEVTSLPDGRARVTRIAELGGSDTKGIVARDIFAFAADANQPGAEGTFGASGVVPRLVGELLVRGVKVDPALFKRAGR
jgi:pilus assembly protein CpaF